MITIEQSATDKILDHIKEEKDFDIKGGKLSIDVNKGKTTSSTGKSKLQVEKLLLQKVLKKAV